VRVSRIGNQYPTCHVESVPSRELATVRSADQGVQKLSGVSALEPIEVVDAELVDDGADVGLRESQGLYGDSFVRYETTAQAQYQYLTAYDSESYFKNELQKKGYGENPYSDDRLGKYKSQIMRGKSKDVFV